MECALAAASMDANEELRSDLEALVASEVVEIVKFMGSARCLSIIFRAGAATRRIEVYRGYPQVAPLCFKTRRRAVEMPPWNGSLLNLCAACGTVPDEFRCPLTLDVMTRPVRLLTPCDRRYEQAAIERWLEEKPRRDPMTGIDHDPPLRFKPDPRLQRRIEVWRRGEDRAFTTTISRLLSSIRSDLVDARRRATVPRRKREDIYINGRCVWLWEDSSDSEDGSSSVVNILGRKMKIALVTLGSRGDVQPYLGIALSLKEAGHAVTIMTSVDFESAVAEQGIAFRGIFQSIKHKLQGDLKKSMASGDATEFGKFMSRWLGDEAADEHFGNWLSATRDLEPDIVLVGTLCDFYGVVGRYVLRIPTIFVRLFHVQYDAPRNYFGLPTLPLGLTKYAVQYFVEHFVRKSWKGRLNEACKRELGVDAYRLYSNDLYAADTQNPWLTDLVVAQPIELAQILHPGRSPRIKCVGYCVLSDQSHNDVFFGNRRDLARVDAFLEKHPKVVYCGWGSMICPDYMPGLVVGAIRRAKLPAIIFRGEARLSLPNESADDLLFVDSMPHEILFPKCDVVWHHGGAGTTAAAMRAGRPQIITPVFMDQYDHARAINVLGIGFGFEKQLHKITMTELADALVRCANDPAVASTARNLAPSVKAQDGNKAIVDHVHHVWHNEVLPGHHKAALDRKATTPWRPRVI
ncbi:hypothetical protein CTAYLR_010490 [Chrysophaeum taylorii]|uniref:U-box domain-containing protein n=1 Tax=Chrysophaeum taylorii TaxID=2483200 RepID=A0AAD7U7D1_9STRA|nr:hypothetical protein CTAYLR_010490 [Chrysophaeum taylorii]